MNTLTQDYTSGQFFDELIDANSEPRAAARALFEHLDALDPIDLEERRQAVNAARRSTPPS
jgi:uncharacterized circularly permuted ATP-grasp superfamily protein